MTCATRSTGYPTNPRLTPIPVGGPFDRVDVDVVKLPKTTRGNSYVIVFMDYLTKWPEAFATTDQTSLTIAKNFVEEIISRHGVPRELLSDRGPSFLSKMFLSVCSILGVKKLNTTAYHPQTDGLVERFNRTLISMLSKRVTGAQEWDDLLPYALFAYRASLQVSTGESPFHLLYGREPHLPTELNAPSPTPREMMPLDGYKAMMVQRMIKMWDVAQQSTKKAQERQKISHDRKARDVNFRVGDYVFVHTPTLKMGPAYKLARPYKGPYRIVAIYPNGAKVVLARLPPFV